jgi:polysaccharide deacetylase family protein (PEP-CTERM system associated)
MTITNYLSIDVEDYFQVSAFEKVSPPEVWKDCEYRVDRNTEKILSILEEFDVKATFFVLGWVAQHFPDLVRKISNQGHEVASHGFGHRRVTTQNRQAFREDIRSSKALLEDISGVAVQGYRAPSYSISMDSLWAYDELEEAGYCYDSSVFPVRHDLYGIPDWPRFPFYVIRKKDSQWAPEVVDDRKKPDNPSSRLLEIPITTLKFFGKNIPIAGGGYFRLFPYDLTRWGLRRINHLEDQPFVFYLHPWEFDPDQPRMAGAGLKSRFRHYLNLHRTENRFRRLLNDFSFTSLDRTLIGVEGGSGG